MSVTPSGETLGTWTSQIQYTCQEVRPLPPGRIPRARLAGPRFPVSFSTHYPPDPARPEDGAAAQAEECAPAGPGPASWRGEGAPPGAALGPQRRQQGKRPAADRRSAERGPHGASKDSPRGFRFFLEVLDFLSVFSPLAQTHVLKSIWLFL